MFRIVLDRKPAFLDYKNINMYGYARVCTVIYDYVQAIPESCGHNISLRLLEDHSLAVSFFSYIHQIVFLNLNSRPLVTFVLTSTSFIAGTVETLSWCPH